LFILNIMALQFITLDVFTTTKYEGNPLAVIHVPASSAITQAQKLHIAKEFNLSETVFLHEQTAEEKQSGDVRINIFTTTAEIPFAGHPTVGTSNYLLHMLKLTTAKTLVTMAGRIPIQTASIEGSPGVAIDVSHDFHIHNSPFKDQSYGHFPVVSIVNGMTFILAKQASLEELATHTDNFVGRTNTYKVRTALDEGWQNGLVMSYFYVDLGVDESGTRLLRTRGLASFEDPATGSAASALCSWLTVSEGKSVQKYRVNQGVEMGRSSFIYLEVSQEAGVLKYVKLSGCAVQVMKGEV
jgi:PhzF family phenazine biosynthesis protein